MTYTLKQAADFLKLHPGTLQERAKRGMIPGAAKPGKRWVFLEEGLRQYLLSLSPCPSTASVIRGISTSRPIEGGLDAVLRLPSAKKPRRTTTA